MVEVAVVLAKSKNRQGRELVSQVKLKRARSVLVLDQNKFIVVVASRQAAEDRDWPHSLIVNNKLGGVRSGGGVGSGVGVGVGVVVGVGVGEEVGLSFTALGSGVG